MRERCRSKPQCDLLCARLGMYGEWYLPEFQRSWILHGRLHRSHDARSCLSNSLWLERPSYDTVYRKLTLLLSIQEASWAHRSRTTRHRSSGHVAHTMVDNLIVPNRVTRSSQALIHPASQRSSISPPPEALYTPQPPVLIRYQRARLRTPYYLPQTLLQTLHHLPRVLDQGQPLESGWALAPG